MLVEIGKTRHCARIAAGDANSYAVSALAHLADDGLAAAREAGEIRSYRAAADDGIDALEISDRLIVEADDLVEIGPDRCTGRIILVVAFVAGCCFQPRQDWSEIGRI